jgi:hypothetical protein
MERITILMLVMAFLAVDVSAAELTDEDLGVVIQQGCSNFR